MRQKVQRNLDDLDPALRAAAENVARKAGMPLAEWLNAVVAEKAAEDRPGRTEKSSDKPRSAARSAPQREDDAPISSQIDAIAERMRGLSDPAFAPTARDVRTRRASDALLHETSLKTVAALESVTRWMEESNQRWATNARETDERHERSAMAFTRAFDMMSRRLDQLETQLAPGAEQPALKPVWSALQRMEQDIAQMAARGDDVARLERTLSGFETRLGTIAERLASTAPRGRMRRDGLSEALADIRSRQSELDQPGAAPDAATIADLNAGMARLTVQLQATPEPAPSSSGLPSTERLAAEMARLSDALEEMAPRSALVTLNEAVADIGQRLRDGSLGEAPVATTAAIQRLHGEIRDVAGILGRTTENLSAEIRTALAAANDADSGDAARLAEEVADLRRFVTMGPDRGQIDKLATQVQDLNGRISAIADRQVDPAAFASLRGDIDAIRSSMVSGGAGPSEDGRAMLAFVDGLKAQMEALSDKIDALGERAAEAGRAPSESDTQLHKLLKSLVERLDKAGHPLATGQAGASVPAPAIEAIERKLDLLAERLETPAPAATKGLEQALADLTLKLDTMRTAPRDDVAATDALERAIEALATRIDAVNPKGGISEDETRRIVGETLKSATEFSSERIDQTLGAIGSTLDNVLNRLAMIEREQIAPAPAAASVVEDDLPLEPGSGRPSLSKPAAPAPAQAKTRADARVTSDDDDLAGFEQPIVPSRNDAPSARSAAPSPAAQKGADGPAPALVGASADRASMIAAARRAMQAATEEAASPAGTTGFAARLRNVAGRKPAEPALPKAAQSNAAQAKAASSISVKDGPIAEPVSRETTGEPAADGARGARAALGRLRATLNEKRRPLLLAIAAIVVALGAAQVWRSETAQGPLAPAPDVSVVPRDPDVTNAIGRSNPGERSAVPAQSGQQGAVTGSSTSQPPSAQAVSPAPTAVATPNDPLPPSVPPSAAPAIGMQMPLIVPGIAPPAETVQALPRVAGIKPSDLTDAIGQNGLRNAALAGDPVALYEVASRLAEGRGVTANVPAALKLYERLGAEGFAPAQFRLGNMYEKGTAGRRDLVLAKAWYERAAERGNIRAMHNLAVIFAEGGSGTPDYASAVRWFERASAFGVSDSQYNLAILKARGLGTERDLKASFGWFSAAASQGDADAARKRDEVGARLSTTDLAAAIEAAEKFQPVPADKLANEVVLPDNGFDETAASKAAPKGSSKGVSTGVVQGQKRARS